MQSKALCLQTVGVQLDKDRAIKVDPYSRTTVENIWAVGDVTNRMPLTPAAIMEGMAFAATVFGNKPTSPVFEKASTGCLQHALCLRRIVLYASNNKTLLPLSLATSQPARSLKRCALLTLQPDCCC